MNKNSKAKDITKRFKKILLVVPAYSSFKDPYQEAFKELKIDNQLFDYRETILPEKIVFALSLVIRKITRIQEDLFYKLATQK